MEQKVPQEITLPNKGVFTFTGDFEHWRQFSSTYPYKDLWFPVYVSSLCGFHVSGEHAIEVDSNSGFKPDVKFVIDK